METLPANDSFVRLRLRTKLSLFEIFRRFVTDEVIVGAMGLWRAEDLMLGGASTSGNPRKVTPKLRYVWESLAVYISLCGE
jgi:hypothetical protein